MYSLSEAAQLRAAPARPAPGSGRRTRATAGPPEWLSVPRACPAVRRVPVRRRQRGVLRAAAAVSAVLQLYGDGKHLPNSFLESTFQANHGIFCVAPVVSLRFLMPTVRRIFEDRISSSPMAGPALPVKTAFFREPFIRCASENGVIIRFSRGQLAIRCLITVLFSALAHVT